MVSVFQDVNLKGLMILSKYFLNFLFMESDSSLTLGSTIYTIQASYLASLSLIGDYNTYVLRLLEDEMRYTCKVLGI